MKIRSPRNVRRMEKGPGNWADELMDALGDDERQKQIFEMVPASMKIPTRTIYKNDLRKLRRDQMGVRR